jgi:hypothetical protein
MAKRSGRRVRLFTRNGNDWSELFPAVVTAVQQFDISSCLIDGEIVVCDEHGLGRDDGEIERVITAMSERPGGGLTACLSAQRRKSKSHPQDVARRHRPRPRSTPRKIAILTLMKSRVSDIAFDVLKYTLFLYIPVIRERVLAGMSRAAASGTRSGKPIGRPRLAPETEANIRTALERGDMGMRKVAVQFGVATGTVQRVARQIVASTA